VRPIGLVCLLLGLLAFVVGTFSGCGSLFSWNGRHPVGAHFLGEGRSVKTLMPEPGRRYTVSVQAVFDREGLESREGMTVVESKMPLVVRVKDPGGTVRAEVNGWLDPNEPPNVLYGQSAHEAQGPISARAMPELVVERLVGPFIVASKEPLSVEVDLGADRIGQAHVIGRRLVFYDDALPPKIRNAFLAAAAGGAALFIGAALLVTSWWRRRRGTRKRGGIPAHDVV
jgi:hypothetical protein